MARQGWEVQAATCLSEAWSLLELGTDVLILDMMLPDGDGLSILQLIRDEGRPIKVVVTTGSNDRRKLDRVRDLRPDSLLLKPVDLDQLLVAIGPPDSFPVST